ncbi:hypothetical protein GWI33_001789 [Rhynchophorus ferrugineus]|uniref:Uncharacterized protein n=1 Tax=Rhynchophorus ferrugineus TaxID=354439 RepID=A0A834IL32_RHYFE|nr:hypothetical protein GWI33_001789 [Rhynchophorus ferrugineus]
MLDSGAGCFLFYGVLHHDLKRTRTLFPIISFSLSVSYLGDRAASVPTIPPMALASPSVQLAAYAAARAIVFILMSGGGNGDRGRRADRAVIAGGAVIRPPSLVCLLAVVAADTIAARGGLAFPRLHSRCKRFPHGTGLSATHAN